MIFRLNYVLLDGIAGHTQPPGPQTDIPACFFPASLDHHAAFLANWRAVALRVGCHTIFDAKFLIYNLFQQEIFGIKSQLSNDL